MSDEHSELAYSWPALVFGLAIVCVVAHCFDDAEWIADLGLVLIAATFFPCCLIRDWWVDR